MESRTVARAACIGSWLGGCAMLPFHLQAVSNRIGQESKQCRSCCNRLRSAECADYCCTCERLRDSSNAHSGLICLAARSARLAAPAA